MSSSGAAPSLGVALKHLGPQMARQQRGVDVTGPRAALPARQCHQHGHRSDGPAESPRRRETALQQPPPEAAQQQQHADLEPTYRRQQIDAHAASGPARNSAVLLSRTSGT